MIASVTACPMPVTTVSVSQPAAASWTSSRAAVLRGVRSGAPPLGASVLVALAAAGDEAVMS